MILAGEKPTKSDDGWLTVIDKIYPRNLVGLISANIIVPMQNDTSNTVALSIFSQIHSLRKL